MGIEKNKKQFEDFNKILNLIAKGPRSVKSITRKQAEEALLFLVSEKADPAKIAAFLTAMRLKGADDEELVGFCNALWKSRYKIAPKVKNLVDACGPYSGRTKTLHLTVPAAIAASAAGVPVILHSNSKIPPKYGISTADILEALNVKSDLSPADVEKMIEFTGFGFIRSSLLYPDLHHIGDVRISLSYQTFMNTCEVISNPANAKLRLFGAAHLKYLERMLYVVKEQKASHAIGVAGMEGSDELPLMSAVMFELQGNVLSKHILRPEYFGLKKQEKFAVKDAESTAQVIVGVFKGKERDHIDQIALNGGIRIYLGKKASSIEKGVEIARDIITDGSAMRKLNEIIEWSHDLTNVYF